MKTTSNQMPSTNIWKNSQYIEITKIIKLSSGEAQKEKEGKKEAVHMW